MSDKESLSKKTWQMDTAELISLVRQRPCLWDRRDPLYRNRLEKDRAWTEIYRTLEPAYEEMSRTRQHEFSTVINRKWYNIRDCYKKFRNGTSRVNVSGRPYLYADHLKFLDDMYASKEITSRKRKRYETKDSTGEPDTEEPEDWLNEVYVDMETSDEPLPVASKKIKTEFPQVKEVLETEDNIVSVLVNLIEKEEDEDRAFFKSITPTVKSLSDDDKFVFRIRVMKLLNALKWKSRRLSAAETEQQPVPPGSDTE